MPSRAQLAEALSWMLDLSHELHPDDLSSLCEQGAEILGAWDTQLYFADLAQDVLLRFSGQGEPELDIDATLAGRAFRTTQPVCTDAPGGRRVWIPIVDGADRLGVLGVLVESDDEAMVSALQRVVTVVAEIVVARSQYGDTLATGRRRRQLSLASEMRWGQLPPQTFVADRITISGVVAPPYEIAGDAFDYSVNGPTAHVAIFDAMGHGLEASRIANLVVGTYRHARRTGLDLLGVHAAIDSVVNRAFGDFTFATGAIAELDLDQGRLRLLLAGHPRPLLLRDRRLIGELEVAPTLPLGVGDPEPIVGDIPLEPDDRVLLYSDGVVEARNAEGEEFGVERLADFLVRAQAAEEPTPETMRRLSKAILGHQGTPLEDDATLLLVHWRRPDE
jgi:serine/threonine protein phosphatase PrpC